MCVFACVSVLLLLWIADLWVLDDRLGEGRVFLSIYAEDVRVCVQTPFHPLLLVCLFVATQMLRVMRRTRRRGDAAAQGLPVVNHTPSLKRTV